MKNVRKLLVLLLALILCVCLALPAAATEASEPKYTITGVETNGIAGETKTLQLEPAPAEGTTVTWSVDKTDLAQISTSDGVTEITYTEQGEVKISASINETVVATANVNVSRPALPTANVPDVPANELPEYPLNFALKFIAATPSAAQKAYYGSWYADFILELNKKAEFNATALLDEDVITTADGFLAGQYDWWGDEWVAVPDGIVTAPANTPIKIMETAAALMGQSGLKLTYKDVLSYVQEFDCGIYFTPEYLQANSDLVVTLALRIYNDKDESESYTIGKEFVYTAQELFVAQIGNQPYISLERAIAAAKTGDTITLLKDISVADVNGIAITKEVAIDLAGKTISFAGDGFVVEEGGKLTISGDGTVKAACGGTGNFVALWAKAGSTEINGGEWLMANKDTTGEGNSLIYAVNGDVVIKEGYFNSENTYNNYGKPWYYVLNRKNSGTGTITVYGGTYENYDPAAGDDVLQVPPHLAEGCVSVKEGEVYKVHKHEVKAVAEVAKQCTIDGVKAHYACAGCGLKYTDAAGTQLITDETTLVIPASHETVFVAAKAATCTEDGNKEHWYCDVCEQAFVNKAGDALAEDVVIKAAHTPVKAEAAAATCTKAGTKEHYKCACGALFSDAEGKNPVTAQELATELAAHTLKPVDEVAATYTTPGVKAHYACQVCAEKFTDAEGKTKATDANLAIAQLIEVVGDKAEVSEGAVDKAIEEAVTSGDSKDVQLDLTHKDVIGEENAPVSKAEIPVAAIEKVAEAEASLTLTKEDAVVTLDTKALEAVAEAVKEEEVETITLVVKEVKEETLTTQQQEAVKDKKVAKVISAELIVKTASGEKNIGTEEAGGFGGGTVTVKIEFEPETGYKGSDYVVLYIADDGTVKEIDTTYADGFLVVDLEHFSEYVIVNNAQNDGNSASGGTGSSEAKPTEPTKPAAKPGNAAPNTGDNANIVGLFAVLVVSGLLAAALLVFKKKARA